MITIEEWRANKPAQIELSNLISSKLWGDIKDLVRQELNTETASPIQGEATAIEKAALKAAQINGRDLTIEIIEGLANPVVRVDKPLPKPFSHLRKLPQK